MSRFNSYFNGAFHGCPRLGFARDETKGRNVALYAIPGEWEIVGIYDGVDVWIAPAKLDPFKLDVVRKLARLQAGESFPIEDGTTRMRFNDHAAPIKPRVERKRVIEPAAAPTRTERKRVINT